MLSANGQYASIRNGDINAGFKSNLKTELGDSDSSAECENILDSYFAAYYAVHHMLTGVYDPFSGIGVVTSFHHGWRPSPLEGVFGTFGSPNNFFGFPFVNGKPTAMPYRRVPIPIPKPIPLPKPPIHPI